MSNKDKVTVKIINKATQEIIAEFNGNEYEVLIEQEKVTEVNMNPKSCDNCGYSFIKANDSVQCYNPYTDFFARSSHSPCDFWDKNKGLVIETITETRLCKNCKHFLIYNNDLCECECTNRIAVPLHSCQLWEGVI